jgi:cation:H+ antiporter
MHAATRGIASGLFFLAAAVTMSNATPWSIFWTAPLLLVASVLIAWGAESAQFFIAQGFALAILALLQTLPEFAVEAVLAWHRQSPLLISNLTGALRLLTGVGWPLIYVTAAVSHRRRGNGALRRVCLDREDGVQIVTLIVCVTWAFVMFFKGSLGLIDAGILVLLYAGYLYTLRCMPPESEEAIEEIESVPRAIVNARPPVRNTAIAALFVAGGVLIYFVAAPFLASLLAVAAAAGISQFVAVQWIAPFVSEFPEKVSAFYWARTVDRASIALMNMISSNINQWTLLAAMLPIVLSIASGGPTAIHFDREQEMELLMTAAQSLLGALLLLDLELWWWEAAGLFVLWFVQFVFSVVPTAVLGVHLAITALYFLGCALQIIRMLLRQRMPPAFAVLRDLRRRTA